MDGAGFWNTVGPYMGGAIVILIGVIFADIKGDVKWLKRNLTQVMTQLGIKPEGD